MFNLKKDRNIHHDTFCRSEDLSEIGNNALPNRKDVMAYTSIKLGHLSVGIHCVKKSDDEINDYFANTNESRAID